jgi:molybdenum cofactor synthesis domain-containing protein
MSVRIAVLTVSDQGAAGLRSDTSGDVLAEWVEQRGYQLSGREIVTDDTDLIAAVLVRWADDRIADLIVTTGGTGLGPRDVTPEATRAVIEREAPGVAEALRADGRASTPHSVLSRGVAGIRGAALIVNLPGGTGGVRDGIVTLSPIIEHAVRLLRQEPTEH